MLVDLLAFWVHDLDPVIFQISERIAIRWYGLAYVAAFLSGYLLLRKYYSLGKSPLNPDALENFTFSIILGILIGGRVGYVLLYGFRDFVEDPLYLVRVWEGGMASHGGFAGVIIACLIFGYRQKLSPLRLGDILVTVIPPGLFFGRIANFINGELWGKVTDVAWAVRFPASMPPGTPVEFIAARHPSQIYQAMLEGVILFIFVQLRFWKTDVTRHPGRLSGEFILAYGVVRSIGEIFREPDASLILGMSRGTFYSLAFMLVGIVLWGISMKKRSEEAKS